MPPMRGSSGLVTLWDNPPRPFPTRSDAMPTTIKYQDLVESIAASLQYIS